MGVDGKVLYLDCSGHYPSVYIFKTHRTGYFKWVHFSVYKLYLSEVELLKIVLFQPGIQRQALTTGL